MVKRSGYEEVGVNDNKLRCLYQGGVPEPCRIKKMIFT